jgi:Txe/YoeB family toxin of Txe-Axe toxin-antitoxin module
MYRVDWTRQAKKDYNIAVKNGYRAMLAEMLSTVERNPYEPTPGHCYEELKGNLKGIHTRQLNHTNRFAYHVLSNDEKDTHPETGEEYEGVVKIINMWGHYPPKWSMPFHPA